jgi:hypothetical protein
MNKNLAPNNRNSVKISVAATLTTVVCLAIMALNSGSPQPELQAQWPESPVPVAAQAANFGE